MINSKKKSPDNMHVARPFKQTLNRPRNLILLHSPALARLTGVTFNACRTERCVIDFLKHQSSTLNVETQKHIKAVQKVLCILN